MKLQLIYRRRWWLFYLPVMLCTALAIAWSVTRWHVLPPSKTVIAAGSTQGSYTRLAQRYAEQLERLGITVEIVHSDTIKGSLDRIMAPDDVASIGFAHGIYAKARMQIQALAVVGQEPVWIFSGVAGLTSLTQAKGARVAIGVPSSSSAIAAKLMLAQAGIAMEDVHIQTLSGVAGAEALIDGKTDLLFQVEGEDSQTLQLLTKKGNVQILSADLAGALAIREPALQPMLLPQGAIELRGDIPPRDLTLASLQTHLLIRPGLHPALQRALLDAAMEIHGGANFLQRQRQFPSFSGSDFPLSPTARAYSLGERPWMERLLPYRKAQYAEMVVFGILPILGLALLVLTWVPWHLDWRLRSELNHFYGELKFLENKMQDVAKDNPIALRALLEKLDNIEQQVAEMDLPDDFSEHWYTLREHLAAARRQLLELRSR